MATSAEFRYIDSRGIDKGINVREQAKLTLRLIENEAGLTQERVKCMQQHARFSESLGTKAQPKNTQASRANTFAQRANVMPNGEVAPDLAQQERQAVRNAQVASYNEWGSSAAGQTAAIQAQQYTSPTPAPAAASTPSGNPGASADPNRAAGNNNMTEDDALAYALRVSAIESGADGSNYQQHMAPAASPIPAPAPAPMMASHHHVSGMSPEEEEQLAIALSLSLAEVTAANNVLNSDDESDGEITPPSTPYQGSALSTVVNRPIHSCGCLGASMVVCTPAARFHNRRCIARGNNVHHTDFRPQLPLPPLPVAWPRRRSVRAPPGAIHRQRRRCSRLHDRPADGRGWHRVHR